MSRLREIFDFDKKTVVHLTMGVIIAVIISAVVMSQTRVSGGVYNADMARIEQGITTMGSDVADNAQDIDDLERDTANHWEQYNGFADDLTLQFGNITALDNRLMGIEADVLSVEADIETLNSEAGDITANLTSWDEALSVLNLTLAGNVADVLALGLNLTALDTQVEANAAGIAGAGSDIATLSGTVANLTSSLDLLGNDVEIVAGNATTLAGNVTALQDEIATMVMPAIAYLSGNLTSGNLTIHARAPEAGYYTANVHLVFASVATNWTATVNWTAPNVKDYIAVENHSGDVVGAWWNVGTFELTADTDTDINVLFGGLADTVSFAYVEIYPVLK